MGCHFLFFHKWEKYDRPMKLAVPSYYVYTETRQKRVCKKCGKVEDNFIKR